MKPAWSLSLERPARGMALAREAFRVAVWDSHWLFWTNRDGQRQAQARFAEALAGAACSEDGSVFAACRADGHVAWLAPDLLPRWEKSLPAPATAVALDPLGIFLAVGDTRGKLHVFDQDGNAFRELSCPRPVRCLAFEPTTGRLVAAADLGWVGAFDLEKGEMTWRDTPFVNIAALAVAVSGGLVALACFSDGLRLYQDWGKPQKPDAAVPPCRLVALGHDGKRTVVAGLDGTVAGFQTTGGPVFTHQPESAPVALALSALGETLYLTTAGKLEAIDLRKTWP